MMLIVIIHCNGYFHRAQRPYRDMYNQTGMSGMVALQTHKLRPERAIIAGLVKKPIDLSGKCRD